MSPDDLVFDDYDHNHMIFDNLDSPICLFEV